MLKRLNFIKNWHKLSLLVLGLILLGGFYTVASVAAEPSDSAASTTQTINHSYFRADQTVTVNDTVNGDVYAVGQTVTINGTINGDVLAAGQTIIVNGTINGNVRAAGQTINIIGSVKKSVSLAAQSITIDQKGTIDNDAVLAADSAVVNGRVGRDITSSGNQFVINGTIGRNFSGITTNLILGPSSVTKGSLTYTSNNQVSRADGATVTGPIQRHQPDQQNQSSMTIGDFFSMLVYALLATLLITITAGLLIPRWLQTITNRTLTNPWKALLVGFITSLATPIALILIFATIFGIPFAIFGTIIWVSVSLIGVLFTAHYIGRLLLRNRSTPLLTVMSGGSILTILLSVPFLNILVFLISSYLGIGALLLEFYARKPFATKPIQADKHQIKN